MSPTLHIREANADDAEAMHSVHAAAIRALQGTYPRRTLQRWLSLLAPEDYAHHGRDELFAVAERNGQVIAFGEANLRRGSLLALYVHPTAARTGVGARLLRHLEESARSSGARRMDVLSSVNAESFYARHGYRVVGVARKRVAEDFAVEGIEMEKPL